MVKSKLDLEAIRAPLQATHDSKINHSYAWRRHQLQCFSKMVRENHDAIAAALNADLGKDQTEAALEYVILQGEVEFALSNLQEWMTPMAVASPGVAVPARSRVEPRPLLPPACLIIGASNYPWLLSLQPLVGCLAAGNPAVVKPSELAHHTAQLLQDLISRYFDKGAVQCVQGGIAETSDLIHQRWGLIFFTGSERVGRIVQQAAATTLTPTLLELGGKCPCIVDETANGSQLGQIANRIIWAKTLNCGQTCAAIDYVVVHEKFATQLVAELKRSLEAQFTSTPKSSELGRMVCRPHAVRQQELIAEMEKHVIVGSSQECDPDTRYVRPTIVLNPPLDSRMMQEEIFGPILPVLTVSSRQRAIELVQSRPGTAPLCLYVFTASEAVFSEWTKAVPTGSAVRNDALLHFGSMALPIGGIGTSGIGQYHGKHSFDCFSHSLACMYRPCAPGMDLGMLRMHPWKGVKGRAIIASLETPHIPVLLPRMLRQHGALGITLAALGAVGWFAVPSIRFGVLTQLARATAACASWLQGCAEWLKPERNGAIAP